MALGISASGALSRRRKEDYTPSTIAPNRLLMGRFMVAAGNGSTATGDWYSNVTDARASRSRTSFVGWHHREQAW
jgi:hypothetical protein